MFCNIGKRYIDVASCICSISVQLKLHQFIDCSETSYKNLIWELYIITVFVLRDEHKYKACMFLYCTPKTGATLKAAENTLTLYAEENNIITPKTCVLY